MILNLVGGKIGFFNKKTLFSSTIFFKQTASRYILARMSSIPAIRSHDDKSSENEPDTKRQAVKLDEHSSEVPIKIPVVTKPTEEPKRVGTKIPKFLTANRKGKVKRKYTQKNYDPTNPFGVLLLEVEELFKENNIAPEKTVVHINKILNSEELLRKYNRDLDNVKVQKLTASGDGLALVPHPEIENGFQAVVIPFALPNEIVNIRIFRTHPSHSEADLVKIIEKSSLRKDELINCKYFGKCSGCQFQSLEYEDQLRLKRKTIQNAYSFFAKNLVESKLLPVIGETIASPLKYKYRTKLTPHFDLPRGKFNPESIRIPSLGFGAKGRPNWRPEAEGGNYSILDIEDCPIGTPIINEGMKNEREVLKRTYKLFLRGSTILLREHTRVQPVDEDETKFANSEKGSKDPDSENVCYIKENDLIKTCVTESRQIVTENVEGKIFNFSAGEFFQNNNSILPIVTKYVRDALFLEGQEDRYLVDAYCGSGLFSIMCSEGVKQVVGVEVSKDSVAFAKKNAELNKITNADFIVGNAEKIFEDIKLPPNNTSVICDPPRKGCSEAFLTQLSDFNPKKIIYISCNVHSQAKDLDFFINNTNNGKQYRIDSIRGFDFFPQTHHVESVAILSKA